MGIYDKINDDCIRLKREALKSLLFQCTSAQQDKFNRIYKSVEEISEKDMKYAFVMVERTIEMNSKNPC